jgi:dihydroorotase
MLAGGFLPDVISSDVHALSIDGPAYNQLVTMSKLLSLGMELTDVIRAGTCAAGNAIGRPELGRLQSGGIGDAAILELDDGDFAYRDSLGEERRGRWRLNTVGIVVGGAWWHPPHDRG